MMLIDTHTHIDLFGENENQALAEIRQYHIFSIANSMDPDSYQKNPEIGQDNGVEILFSEHIKNIARKIPMERMLTETDNPLVKLSLPLLTLDGHG